MSATILEEIVETKRQEVADAKHTAPLESLQRVIAETAVPRAFYSAVAGENELSLIAEIKKASPSAGLIRSDFDRPIGASIVPEGSGGAPIATAR